MRLRRVFVRFYKSFNYDYERKFARASKPDPWEMIGDAWYPYVRMDVDPSITTIVGANESGKSHLLDAIETLITGADIERSAFCRYSRFFSVQQGERRTPDFGGEFDIVDAADAASVKKHLGLDVAATDKLSLYRENGAALSVLRDGADKPVALSATAEDLAKALPAVFRLNADLPLPASIPLYELSRKAKRPYGSRSSRRSVFEGFLGKPWSNADEFAKAAPQLYGLLSTDKDEVDTLDQQYELGRALLFKVARIDETAFKDLSDAIEAEREGYVNGVIQRINADLARYLNFPRWWAQDREFRLMVSPREYELVFTIRDRTGTDYSFSERSNGLKYFLSYYVQLLAHERPSGQQEILLMDEPDAFLSSQGQQDLLRILNEFALPEDGSRQDQVLYVTHSPFLINRNAAERIRVLDKGSTEEGTRVVKDVARNHYEPLRSSLGGFVAETSFIGGSNLFVEGLADQVLLAGLSSHLLRSGRPRIDLLDLNEITIVPAGSASSVPYLVYLARGRDVVRPPCVVLLDSDTEGNEAAKTLARGGARGKQLLAPEFVLKVGAWAADVPLEVQENVVVQELEDLLSVKVAIIAARQYATTLSGMSAEEAAKLTEADIERSLAAKPGSLFDAVAAAFTQRFGPEAHIEKVGFAKEAVAAVGSLPAAYAAGVEQNFFLLLSSLARLLRKAIAVELERRLNNRLNRVVEAFLSDHPKTTTRERGRLLIEEVQGAVDNSEEGDRVKLAAAKLSREFHLDEDLLSPIERYPDFKERVEALRYQERLMKQTPESKVDQAKSNAAEKPEVTALP